MLMRPDVTGLHMIILHACLSGGSLDLWGEAEDDGRTRAPTSKRVIGRMHPYSATRSEIRDAFVSHGIKIGRDISPSSGVWLPSADGRPIRSDDTGRRPGSSLSQWVVETVDMSVRDTVLLLSWVLRGMDTVAGMTVGADLAYWACVMRFAGSLVARQRFLPDMQPDYDEFLAWWRPVFSEGDRTRLVTMAGLMPAAARAMGDGTRARPKIAPITALKSFIDTLVNHMIYWASSVSVTPGYAKQKRFKMIHDEWIHGLTTAHSGIEISSNSLDLAKYIREWMKATDTLEDPSMRMCIRIEEPGEDKVQSGQWSVKYFVQYRTDPDRMVPADKVLDSGFSAPDGVHVRGFLLRSLGHASVISAGIAAGLKSGGAGGYETDTAGAYRFLREEAPILEQSGFGIETPEWWSGSGATTRLSAHATVRGSGARTGGMLDLNSSVGLDWRLDIGGSAVTPNRLRDIAGSDVPLVSVHGRWVDTGSGQVRRAADFIADRSAMTVRNCIMTGLGTGAAPDWMDVKISGGRIGNTIEALRGDRTMAELPQPDGFSGTLRPYQIRGYSWMSFLQETGLGGCLADDMGLGKTVQVLALIQRHVSGAAGRHRSRPVLVVCPTSVIDNWKKEASRFAPGLSVMIHHGTGRKKDDAFATESERHDIVITSYGLMQRDVEFVRKMQWEGVILDEAQNIRNPSTGHARAARSLEAGFKFALTGTPVENNVGDLWSIMEFLNPGLLGTRAQFRRNFLTPIQKGRDVAAIKTLRKMTGPFILRRLKTDRSVISDLPEKMESDVYCPLTREQVSLYEAVLVGLEKGLHDADGIRRKGMILATLTKLKQVCNHPAHFLKDGSAVPGRSGKLERLMEMLVEVTESGGQALVFTQFVEMGKILQRHICDTLGCKVSFLHGGTTRGQRSAMVDRFQRGGDMVLIVSLKAGGTGLNLTAAGHVFHFDRWWNPAVEDQATDRAFRIGQRHNVQVYRMVCSGTMEERIAELMRRKREVAAEVVDAGEGWLTNLSDAEIRDVLALSGEAVRM